MIDLTELARLAREATPGPWLYRPRGRLDDWGEIRAGVDGYHVAHARDGDGIGGDPKAMDEHRKNKTDPYERNGRYIAAMSPDACLALIERVRTVEKAMQERAARVCEIMRPHGGRQFDEAQRACYSALTDAAAAIRALPTDEAPDDQAR